MHRFCPDLFVIRDQLDFFRAIIERTSEVVRVLQSQALMFEGLCVPFSFSFYFISIRFYQAFSSVSKQYLFVVSPFAYLYFQYPIALFSSVVSIRSRSKEI